MIYEEWSKSIDLDRTLTPNSPTSHDSRMEEKIFEQKLTKETKGRKNASRQSAARTVRSTRRGRFIPNSFVTFVNFCSKIFVFPDSCLCSGLMDLENAIEPGDFETERKRWLGWKLALPTTKQERMKLANLANFKPAKMPEKKELGQLG